MKHVFINSSGQLRSGWKISITLTSFFIATSILLFIVMLIIVLVQVASSGNVNAMLEGNLNIALDNNSWVVILAGIVQSISMIFMAILWWKLLDKKPVRHMGLNSLKKGYKDLAIGLLFGIISISAVTAVLLATGLASFSGELQRPNISPSLFTGLLTFVFVGVSEEVFSRGYCMTVLNQTGKPWVSVLVSSIIFSLMHSLNPNINLLAFTNIFLVGVLFALMFIKSGSLWMPIGYHITWNYFQGNVFGLSVSGLKVNGLYKITTASDSILSGGKFGPEGGLVTTLILLLGLVVIWKLYGTKPSNISSPLPNDSRV